MDKSCVGCGTELKFRNTPIFDMGVLKDGDHICSKCFAKMVALIGGGKFKAKNFTKDEAKNYIDNYEALLREKENKSIENKNSKITNKAPVNSNKESVQDNTIYPMSPKDEIASVPQDKLENSSNAPLNNLSKCPKCGSEEWKLASLIHKEGITTFTGTTVGVGVTKKQQYTVGVGKVSGKQQTELSKQASPPTTYLGVKIFIVTAIISAVFGLYMAGSRYSDFTLDSIVIFWFALSIICIVGAILRFPSDKRKRNLLMDRYQKTKMCTRCGAFYYSE